MPESISRQEAHEADYEAIGLQVLADLGIEDPEDFGAINVSAGDDRGECTGTMAEAVGRHSMVRESLEEIVEESQRQGLDPREEIAQDRMFKRFMMRDETGGYIRGLSPGELKKNLNP